MLEHDIIHDPAFEIIPKNSTFFLIWRVENLKLVPLPKENYGKFYSGDAYIVACATEYKGKGDSQTKPMLVKEDLYTHIHFWIGSKATQDEAAIAAIKAIEMDDYLGGSPVQHRETEGHESQRFLSYFKGGIRLLLGGVKTGFRKVDSTIEPALYQVKGKRNPIVKQLPEINWLPFNDGDIFILATGKYIFLWTGKHANNMEKVQGIKAAQAIKAEHGHYCESIVIIDDGEEMMDTSAEEFKAFEEFLPLDKKVVDSYDPKQNEIKYETEERAQVVLYRCNDENGSLKINKVKNGPLVKKDLDSNDAFIIDNDVDGIWVWVGKKASQKERSGGMKYAHELIKLNNYSSNTRITKVIEGAEYIEFKSLFKTWVDEKESVNFGKPYIGRIAKVMRKSFETDKLKENQTLSAETQLVDDGKGEKKIFYVENSQLLPLKQEDYGKFYTRNCYVIVYTYDKNNVIIYFWFGLNSSNEERIIAESKAVELDESKYCGQSVLVRVIECSEPLHLMYMFHGLMIIYKGRYAVDKPIDKCLLQVKGTTEYNTKTVEVECKAKSLNSNCVLILSLPDKNYIWSGKRSIGDKREMAKRMAFLDENKESQLIAEGEESDDFWKALNGKDSYESTKEDKIIHEIQSARLFHRKSGKYEEVVQFDQNDLLDDEIAILDAFDIILIWLGKQIKNKESIKPIKIAEDYIKSGATKRDINLPIYVIKQEHEPFNFTGFFSKWNKQHSNKSEDFDDLKRELRKSFMRKFPIK